MSQLEGDAAALFVGAERGWHHKVTFTEHPYRHEEHGGTRVLRASLASLSAVS